MSILIKQIMDKYREVHGNMTFTCVYNISALACTIKHLTRVHESTIVNKSHCVYKDCVKRKDCPAILFTSHFKQPSQSINQSILKHQLFLNELTLTL